MSAKSGYAAETCGLCRGLGIDTSEPCPVCDGSGTVLVFQPALKCTRCDGDGKARSEDAYLSPRCLVCRGAGWVMALLD